MKITDFDFENVYFFKTESNSYIYDNNSGQIVPFLPEDYDWLIENKRHPEQATEHEKFDSSSEKYCQSLINCGLFYKRKTQRVDEIDWNKTVFYTGTKVMALILGDDCNMRCNYCVFGDAYCGISDYSKERMTIDTAKKAIDYFIDLCNDKTLHGNYSSPVIAFYGGEPLLYFDMIKWIVEYCQEARFAVNFSVTTNATLLDQEKSHFLIKNRMNVLFSLDGDAHETNRNRVLINRKESFELIYKNITDYYQISKDYPHNTSMSFNACHDYKSNLQDIVNFFDDLPFENKTLQMTLVSPGFTTYFDQFTNEEKSEHHNEKNKIYRLLLEQEKAGSIKGIARHSFLQRLMLFKNRTVGYGFATQMPCIPGSKFAVSPKGEFFICERVNKQMPIGDVDNGFDIDKIVDINRKYFAFQQKHCASCNINKLCELCYQSVINDDTMQFDYSKCEERIKLTKKMLVDFVSVLEQRSSSFEYVQ